MAGSEVRQRLTALVDRVGEPGQWPALGFAAVLVAVRVLLEGTEHRWALTALVVVGFVFSAVGLVCGARRPFAVDLDQARRAADTWKALSRSDRAIIRRCVRERVPVPARLLAPAKVVARWPVEFMATWGWLFAGLATMQLGNSLYPWSVGFGVVAIVLGAVFVAVFGRLRERGRLVLAQPDAPEV